jgi:hypothetical protein
MFITICKENVEKTGASYLACGVEDGEGEGDALRGRLGTGGRHTDENIFRLETRSVGFDAYIYIYIYIYIKLVRSLPWGSRGCGRRNGR